MTTLIVGLAIGAIAVTAFIVWLIRRKPEIAAKAEAAVRDFKKP